MASADNQPSDQIGQTEEKEKTTMESGSSTSEELRKVQVANEGMRLLLSSRLKDAENLFVKSRLQGPQLNAGYSFLYLVKALMSFEDDDLDKAYKLLEATEKFCDPSRKFSLTGSPFDQLDSEEKLYRRIIVADCLLFESVLVFLKQGFTSYVKGGYILRKAWKMYGKLYTELEQHCTTPCPISLVGQTHVDSHVGTSIYDEDTTTTDNGDVGENADEDVDALGTGLPGFFSGLEEAVVELEKSIDEEGGMTDKIEEEIKSDRNDVDLIIDQQISGDSSLPDVPNSPIEKLDDWDTRLRTSLYFGYGILNVIVSLIPPKLMKVANLFGFHGSRKIGLQALEYCSNSQDMKAPLARLSLLWYHTIVRPFFALDGEQEDAGADEALRLLTEAEKYYHDSAFFLYFRGKIHYLKSELDLALEAYSYAAGLSREQREIEHVCLFEKGWIHLLKLQFADALPCLIRLKTETRWSACFYAYMSGLIAGMLGDMKQAREMFLQCGKLVKRKNNNLEKFCVRRASVYKPSTTALMSIEMTLMFVELLYLWRALPFCSKEIKLRLLDMIDRATSPNAIPFHIGMRALLMGCILISLNRIPEAEKSLMEAVKFERTIRHDKHIMTFALYELAVIHINRDEHARARLLLTHAKDGFSGYEFEARLNFKVHSATALLK